MGQPGWGRARHGFDADGVRRGLSPLSRGETAYALYRALIVRDDAVLLRLKARNAFSILPAELMPPEVQQLVRAGIARASA
jgi:hypothetical protein